MPASSAGIYFFKSLNPPPFTPCSESVWNLQDFCNVFVSSEELSIIRELSFLQVCIGVKVESLKVMKSGVSQYTEPLLDYIAVSKSPLGPVLHGPKPCGAEGIPSVQG